MKKIRINELARELEVKPHIILDMLPGLGVAEKKTHSSSIDEDIALEVKRRLGGEDSDHAPEAAAERVAGAPAAGSSTQAKVPKGGRVVETQEETLETESVTEPHVEVRGERAEAKAGIRIPQFQMTKAAARPIRPPLAGQPVRRVEIPVTPTVLPPPREPAVPRPQGVSAAPAVVVTPQPQPARPTPGQAEPGAPTAPAMPERERKSPAVRVEAKTAVVRQKDSQTREHRHEAQKAAPPTPRPGEILSGPRQPLPEGLSAVKPIQKLKSGLVPGQPIARPPAVRQTAPQRQAAQAPSSQGEGRQSLAGQPTARPIVPPRADLVARLTQTKSAPGQPVPRPAGPSRPASPVPGQPIYRGPIRPGQPLMRSGDGPGSPARPGRQRGMHPTSTRIEPVPVPVETRRDHGRRPRRPELERESEFEGKLRMPPRRQRQVEAPPPIDREITVSEGITVKELSEKLGVRANLVIKKLVEKKIFATINQTLDVALTEEIARAFGASTNKVSFEEEAVQEIESAEDPKDLVKRAPVVTIMGHVDHGKTSLLDAIREANVAGREAGGITQHIGAYSVVHHDRKIVFIDTPGHEAFTRMRARGAKVTDIVVLVVAADDGVMPQTLEAIDHARAAKVPIIVAINKVDKPDAQPERIKQQLTDRGLMPEEWGGETVMVPVSAKSRQNIELLLEMILLVADMQDLKSSPSRPAFGTVLEAKLDKGRGPVATVLVQNGTLSVGDFFICGAVFGKVRAMFDDLGQPIRQGEPSTPVEVLGLDSLPDVGDVFQQVTDTAKAKQIVLYREAKAREQAMARGARVSLEQLHDQLKEDGVKDLNLIIKADVGGTAEVLAETLQKLSTEKVRIRVLHTGVGAITETDVLLATASNAIVVGFNVRPERNATSVAEQEKVDIRLHTVIYELTDEIKRAMTGLLEPVYREVFRGRAEVRDTFNISKVGTIAGCLVSEGTLTRDSQVRLLRDNIVIFTGKIASLKRFKNDASEVRSGLECGLGIANYNDLKPGDVVEAFQMERVAQEALP